MKTSPVSKSSLSRIPAQAAPRPSRLKATAVLCAVLSLGTGSIIARTGAPAPSPGGGGGGETEKAGVFNEAAGSYQGQGVIAANGQAVIGTADGFIRGGKTGGGMILRGDFVGTGASIRLKRTLTFNRRTYSAKSVLISSGMSQAGSGRGRYSTNGNLLRYNEKSTFSVGGTPQPVNIRGTARFSSRSVSIIENWSVSGQALTFKFRLRPR